MDNLELLRELCRSKHNTIESLAASIKKKTKIETHVRKITKGLSGYEFVIRGEKFFLPEKQVSFYKNNFGRILKLQKKMNHFAIPVCFHIGEGNQYNKIHEISNSPSPELAANIWLNSIFSPEVASTYILQYFNKSTSLNDYSKIIFEAVDAFYMNMPHVAIISLLPVFEAGLRNVQHKLVGASDVEHRSEEFDKGLKLIIQFWGARIMSGYDHYPGKGYLPEVEMDFLTFINPQCDVILAFKCFFSEVLYKPSNGNSDGFNRHLILHLLKNNFNAPSNFIRLFLALTHITFIESLSNESIPMIWPGAEEQDRKLAEYFRITNKYIATAKKDVLQSLGFNL